MRQSVSFYYVSEIHTWPILFSSSAMYILFIYTKLCNNVIEDVSNYRVLVNECGKKP